MNVLADDGDKAQPKRIWSLILFALLFGALAIAAGVLVWVYSSPIEGSPLPNGRQGLLGLIVAIVWSKIGVCFLLFIGAVSFIVGIKCAIIPSQFDTINKGPPCPKCEEPLFDADSEVCLKCNAIFDMLENEQTGEVLRVLRTTET